MKTYGVPVLAWTASVLGLLLALWLDGAADLFATALVGVPLILIAKHLRSARTPN
ncbi:MAG: hypothetical protein AAF645_19845 [Myxococcota bacterium]